MKERSLKGLSGSTLKMIAIITMLLDHIGAVLIEGGLLEEEMTLTMDKLLSFSSQPFWWRTNLILRLVIGRMAFPIFTFLLVEGVLYTRNIKKYGMRLLVFGFLSEIPFDLAVFHTPFYPGYQNVFFTLFFALLALASLRKWDNGRDLWKQAAMVVLCCFFADFLNTDYGAFGVIFAVLLYMTRESPMMQTIAGILATSWELTACLAFIPIRLYNGTKGKGNFKYFFYAFYPLHLLVLYGIWRVLFL